MEQSYHRLAKYACFNCRKCFKRVSLFARAGELVPTGQNLNAALIAFEDSYQNPCPQCAIAMSFVGQAFKAPKQTDVRSWARLKTFNADSGNRRLEPKSVRMKHDHLWYMSS